LYIFILYLVDKENIGGLEDQLEREPGLVDEGEEDDLFAAARLLLRGPAQQLQATAGTVCTPAQLEKCEKEPLGLLVCLLEFLQAH
jgi:hypothetical protein